MRIKNNISAVNASRNHGISQGKMAKSLEKLSSGYRINRAGDDAAGLALSEGMRAQIRGLDQAMRNCDDGIGLVNTGEGTLTEVHSMLHRLKTLAIESANGTYNSTARANIEQERLELLNEIDRIGGSSEFNEIPLFESGSGFVVPVKPPERKDDIVLQIGHSSQETLDVTRYYVSSKALGIDDIDLTNTKDANNAIPKIETAIQAVTTIRSTFGAAENHLQHTHNNLSVTTENMTAMESGIRDADVSSEFTVFTAENIVSQAALSMLTQANAVPQRVLDILQ